MVKSILIFSLKVFGVLLAATIVLKWSVDTCLPPNDAQIFTNWLHPPHGVCQKVAAWESNSQIQYEWMRSQNSMFVWTESESALTNLLLSIQAVVQQMAFPTIVMEHFPREPGITFAVLLLLTMTSLIGGVLLEWISSTLGGLKTSVSVAPGVEVRHKRRLTATIFLLKPVDSDNLVVKTTNAHSTEERIVPSGTDSKQTK
jgi:hypothetical protein